MNAELEKWMDVWDKAQEKGIFDDDAPKPPLINQQVYSSDYFGNVQVKDKQEDISLNECDAKYWNLVYRLSKHQGESPDVFKEEKSNPPLGSEPIGKTREVPKESDLAVKGAELGNTANPIEPPSRGNDALPRKVTPNWSDGEELRELVDMKHSLYKLEVKINSHPKFGAYGADAPEIKKIQDQIEDLKEKIDSLSTSLSPDFVQDELS